MLVYYIHFGMSLYEYRLFILSSFISIDHLYGQARAFLRGILPG